MKYGNLNTCSVCGRAKGGKKGHAKCSKIIKAKNVDAPDKKIKLRNLDNLAIAMRAYE